MIKYTIAMSLRVVCLGLCLVVPGWWLLIPALGAVFLPYFAVIIANNVRSGAKGQVERPGALVRVDEVPARPEPERPEPERPDAGRPDAETQP